MNKSSVKKNIIQPNSFSCLLRTQKFAVQEIFIPRASSSRESIWEWKRLWAALSYAITNECAKQWALYM